MKTAAECARSSQMPIHMENTQAKRRRGHFLKQNIYTQLYRGHILRPFFQTLARAHDSPPCMNSSPEAYLTGFCNLCFGKVARRDMFLSLVKPTLLKARSNSWQNFFFSILESNGKTLWGLIAKRKNQSAKGLELYVWVLDSKPHFVNKLGLQLSGCLDAVICWWVSTPLWIGWSKRNSPLKSLLPTCPALCLVATEGIVYTMFLSQFLEKSTWQYFFKSHFLLIL